MHDHLRLFQMLVFGGTAACLFFCATVRAGQESGRATYDVKEVRKTLPVLRWETPPEYAPTLHAYFQYYSLDIPGCEHRFGTFTAANYIIAAHIFTPPQSRGTVVLVHGYYDHAGILKHLVRDLVKRRYSVAIYDQPGHGLSSGERASITDFSEYTAVFEAFLQICRTHMKGPFDLVAHSMGCAVLSDYLLSNRPVDSSGIVFVAPLIHSAAWRISGIGLDLTGTHVERLPRTFRKNSSDKTFLEFMKEDPLQADTVPLKWTKALRAWNDRIVRAHPSQLPLKIIQGRRDTTVDWRYNTRFLKEKFPESELLLIKNGGHQLLNESLPMRQQVLDQVAAFLPKTSKP